ncbi:MAG: NAD(P)-dependent oxidoreductase [Myxococcales bacterium]|nr:NAD(P)-dependent oxidoreductase [Myxococcales bacterium]MCB9643614.1 NAD(P)-dependent oxidoreductase [Myxococcales bacterium]
MSEHSASSYKLGELKPALSRNEALAEANRCLFCYDAPCTRACPTHIDVPKFIKKIASENLKGSAKTILEANILGASCARVCPTEVLCEGACVLNDLHDKPIKIGRLQRYATDPFVMEGTQLFQAGEATGKKVAIVGGGPAGLACAHELTLLGHEAVVFEAQARLGGLNTYGIADYKLDIETSLKEVDWVQSIGFSVRTNTRIGQDVSMSELLADYDAVFIGVGLGSIPTLGMPGEDLAGYEDALVFIDTLKHQSIDQVSLKGQRVAVIGGGNTAIDAVSQSASLGAEKVYMVYRRGREDMGAYDHEIDLALSKGTVEIVYMAQPTEILGEGGKVTGLKCVRHRLKAADASGKSGIEVIEDSDFVLPVDRVFRATGQAKYRDFFAGVDGLEVDRSGRVVVDGNGKTSIDKLWASGDCANGGKEVVNAVAEGKAAAQHIHQALEAKTHG